MNKLKFPPDAHVKMRCPSRHRVAFVRSENGVKYLHTVGRRPDRDQLGSFEAIAPLSEIFGRGAPKGPMVTWCDECSAAFRIRTKDTKGNAGQAVEVTLEDRYTVDFVNADRMLAVLRPAPKEN